MTYKNLMKKVQDGIMEISFWAVVGSYAQVIIYKANGKSVNTVIEVTNCPKDIQP